MVAVLQSTSNSGATGTSLTLTLANPTAASGSCLVVCVAGQTTATTNPAVTGMTLGGSAGNFGSVFSTGGSTDESNLAIWANPNCAGSQTSVVINFTGVTGPNYLASVLEASGLASTIAALLDKSAASTTGANGTSWSTGSTATTSNANQLWVGAVATDGTTITGPSSPWTNIAQVTQGSSDFMSGYQVRSSVGAASYAGSFSPIGFYNSFVVALNPASAPPSNRSYLVPQAAKRASFY
jgi:hypothetical protein